MALLGQQGSLTMNRADVFSPLSVSIHEGNTRQLTLAFMKFYGKKGQKNRKTEKQ